MENELEMGEGLAVQLPDQPGQRWTLKMRKFVYHYVRNGGDVPKAAQDAGYSGKDACYHLLGKPAVKAAIEKELLACLQKEDENSETIMARWSNWIKANVYDYFKMDQDGVLVLRDPSELSEAQQMRVKKITTSVNQYGQNVSIELHDVSKAQDRIAEILGLINSQNLSASPQEQAEAIRDIVGKMHETRLTGAPPDALLN